MSATDVTQSVPACAKAHSLEIFDDVTKVWVDYNSDVNKATKYPYVQNYVSATAVFDVLFTSDLGTTWHGKVVTMRIKSADQYSG